MPPVWSTLSQPYPWCRTVAYRKLCALWKRGVPPVEDPELAGSPLIAPNRDLDLFEQHQDFLYWLDQLRGDRQRAVLVCTYDGANDGGDGRAAGDGAGQRAVDAAQRPRVAAPQPQGARSAVIAVTDDAVRASTPEARRAVPGAGRRGRGRALDLDAGMADITGATRYAALRQSVARCLDLELGLDGALAVAGRGRAGRRTTRSRGPARARARPAAAAGRRCPRPAPGGCHPGTGGHPGRAGGPGHGRGPGGRRRGDHHDPAAGRALLPGAAGPVRPLVGLGRRRRAGGVSGGADGLARVPGAGSSVPGLRVRDRVAQGDRCASGGDPEPVGAGVGRAGSGRVGGRSRAAHAAGGAVGGDGRGCWRSSRRSSGRSWSCGWWWVCPRRRRPRRSVPRRGRSGWPSTGRWPGCASRCPAASAESL